MASSKQVLVPWIYDTILLLFHACLSTFFREISAPGAGRIPSKGPVIIVAAPHNNQFVDATLLMRILKQYAGRRISFLIAEKSTREPYIGPLAVNMGALPVVRAMDNVKDGPGQIYLPDPQNDPTLVRGVGTDFTDAGVFMEGGTIILPRVNNETPDQQSIATILGPEELRLGSPFKQLPSSHPLFETVRTGTAYKYAPHINQTRMFDAVYGGLEAGGCIGIFPEGGSHDRPSLLPLKAGVAIIALGTLARAPDCGLSIIPCGMNYFSPNKFRSRAVVEFGPPVEVGHDQIEAFKLGGQSKRNAVGSLLETIQDALDSVTQQAPDRETLMLVQATRRLYKPLRMKLPLPVVIELNRRLLKGYTHFKQHPQVVQLTKAILAYHNQLKALGVKDYQVEWGNVRRRPWWLVLLTLSYRIGELLVLSIGTIPSLALFWPVFVTTRIISHKKQRQALANSVVKVEARDVVGTWKILVAMGLAPALYIWYTVIVTLWLHYNRHDGFYSSAAPWWVNATTYVPPGVPLWIFSIAFFLSMIAVSFAGLRIGEIGLDIIKSLPPLLVALKPSSSAALVKLRLRRRTLVAQVNDIINTFGPEIFPAFEYERLITDADASGSEDENEADGLNPTYTSQLKSMPASEVQSPDRDRIPTRADVEIDRGGSVHSGSWHGDDLSESTGSGPSKGELGEVNRRIGSYTLRERTTPRNEICSVGLMHVCRR